MGGVAASSWARALVLVLACASMSCQRAEEIEAFSVAAFPQTRARTGVSFFRFEKRARRLFVATALDGRGRELGRLTARLELAGFPKQPQAYERPRDLELRWGTDVLRVDYLSQRHIDVVEVVHRGETLELPGNPAFPARCEPGPLAARWSASEAAALAAWVELLPDLSANLGTVGRRWSGQILLINRASNLTAALCCLSGDVRCCGLPPFAPSWSPLSK